MPDAPRQLPPKKEIALALLKGSSLFVHLDPRRAGVSVPKWFAGQPQLVLQLGLNMQIPIPDLKVEDEAMTCTLSFNRSPFWCCLPWTAIYALLDEDGRGMIWPDDVPPEVQQQMQQKQSAQPAGKPTAKRGKPRLNAVEGRGEGDEDRPTRLKDRRPVRVASAAEARDTTDDGAALEGGLQTTASLSAIDGGDAQTELPGIGEARPRGEPEASPQARPISERPGDKKPKRELPPYLRVIK